MLAFGETCFGAGGSLGGVDDFAVTVGGNFCLCCENFTADRAVLALGEACGDTSGGYGGVDNLGVACCGNLGLSYENFTTYRAMLALGEACFDAGGGYGRIDYFSVTSSRKNYNIPNSTNYTIVITHPIFCT